ncbi:hypothetical protein [Actinomadura sp. 6N118]|uniref:hypothetical protein n=1 Tax=Actinomadura sp. 6N118 TaxID=3375151 RepID=UPI0037B96122
MGVFVVWAAISAVLFTAWSPTRDEALRLWTEAQGLIAVLLWWPAARDRCRLGSNS